MDHGSSSSSYHHLSLEVQFAKKFGNLQVIYNIHMEADRYRYYYRSLAPHIVGIPLSSTS